MNGNPIKKILYITLIALGFVFIVLAVVGIKFYLGLYGGLQGILSELKNPPKAERLDILRNEAIMHLTQAHSVFGSLDGLTLYEKTYSDKCADGEHHWKRSDYFSYLCSYRLTYYYGIEGNYTAILLDLEANMDKEGWELPDTYPKRMTISEYVYNHTGDIFTADLPVYEKSYSERDSKIMELRINNFQGYYSGWRHLEEEPNPFGTGVSTSQIFYEDTSNIQPDRIFERIEADGRKKLLIAIKVDYFQN